MSKQRIFIAGHRGMVGSAIKRQLEQRGDVELVLRTRDELSLLDSRAVHDFFASERIAVSYTHLSHPRRMFDDLRIVLMADALFAAFAVTVDKM